MKKRKILIYDDDPEAVVRWKQKLDDREQIGRSFETFIIRKNDFQSAVDGLEKRRREARQGSNPEPKWNNRLDQTDIFIIDYDLLDADSPSGEEIAYLVRCYSRCGWIIALNQFDKGYGAFDLTLRGHPESFADLNIGDPLLDNPGLWAEPWEGFRPWAWPLLSLALGKFERRIRKLRGNLTRLILEYLMFPEMISRSLPRTTVEFLTKLDDPMKATFVDFVGKSGNGLRGKDQPFCEESSIRIAAARISHWLESLVLPGQNILVDEIGRAHV